MCKLNKVYERYKDAKIIVFGDIWIEISLKNKWRNR